jgi:hypothetical protein
MEGYLVTQSLDETQQTHQQPCVHISWAENLANRIPLDFLEILWTQRRPPDHDRHEHLHSFHWTDFLPEWAFAPLSHCKECKDAFFDQLRQRVLNKNGGCLGTEDLATYALNRHLVTVNQEDFSISLYETGDRHIQECAKCAFLVQRIKELMEVAGLIKEKRIRRR